MLLATGEPLNFTVLCTCSRLFPFSLVVLFPVVVLVSGLSSGPLYILLYTRIVMLHHTVDIGHTRIPSRNLE